MMGRTEENIKLKTPEKPRKIKGFRLGGYRTATTISSRSRCFFLRLGLFFTLPLDIFSALDSCVGWPRLIIGNSPSVSNFHRTRYAIFAAQNLYAPCRDTPPFGCLRDRKMFHYTPARYCPLGLSAKRWTQKIIIYYTPVGE